MIDANKLQRVARRNGIDTPYKLGKILGTSDSQAQRLWEGLTDLKLSTLDRLCDAFKCGPEEITTSPKRAKKRQAAK